jgi:hypothetical protein
MQIGPQVERVTQLCTVVVLFSPLLLLVRAEGMITLGESTSLGVNSS